MGETSDYQALRENIIGPMDRIDRVENPMVSGMPDVNLCIQGIESWIEIKSPTEPKRKVTPLFGSNHKVSQDQKNWHKRQRNSGGVSFFLICTKIRWILILGKHESVINALTIDELLEIAEWSAVKPIGPKTWRHLKETIWNSKHHL